MASSAVAPPACAYCGSPLEGAAAPHACVHCGLPQPLPAAPATAPSASTNASTNATTTATTTAMEGSAPLDFFAALGVPARFAQDPAVLQRRFFELSRYLHPDRHQAAEPRVRQASLERMSLLNQALQTLKDPSARRDYLLESRGGKPAAAPGSAPRASMPMDLAEAWFELQDELTESPATARASAAKFAEQVDARVERQLGEIQRLEAAYDEQPSTERLQAVGEGVQRLSYLRSLRADVARLGGLNG